MRLVLLCSMALAGIATGEDVEVLFEHDHPVLAIALAADGSTIASADGAGFVVIREIAKREPLRVISARGAVFALRFHPRQRLLFGAGAERRVDQWDLESGRLLTKRSGPHQRVCDLAWIDGDDSPIAVGADGRVLRWERSTGMPDAVFETGSAPLWTGDACPRGQRFAAAGQSGVIHLWELPLGYPEPPLVGHTDGICGVAFSRDGRFLASCGSDRSVRLWDPETAEEVRRWNGLGERIRCLAWTSSDLLVAGGEDGSLWAWDALSGDRRFHREMSAGINGVAPTSDGHLVLALESGAVLRLRDAFRSPASSP